MLSNETWKCHSDAEKVLEEGIEKSLTLWLKKFSAHLESETSTRLFNWLAFVTLKKPPPGFIKDSTSLMGDLYYHPGAELPRVLLGDKPRLGLLVEDIGTFFMQQAVRVPILGTSYSPLRRAELPDLTVIERRGTRSLIPISESPEMTVLHLSWKERLKTRDRSIFPKELVDSLVKDLGKGRAAALFLEVEREFWEGRNKAGQIQKRRQDNVGLGWANQDHHTFRSSRVHFHALVNLFESLGFYCRERYYAGSEAGWGAQIMEQPDAFAVVFLDVDLSPDEIAIDFAHTDLPDRTELGTIGLWCGLHGDSILEAGMHHLEAQFLFETLTKDLVKEGVEMMAPFSHFNYLKQAFTKGERWKVAPEKLQKLLSEGKVTAEQAHKFEKEGALGSHMENLERREGYKGFNQKNVSMIIRETDPRDQH